MRVGQLCLEGLGFDSPDGSRREETAPVRKEGRDTGQTAMFTKSTWLDLARETC